MTQIPPNQVTAEDMATWYKLKDQLAKVKAAEMLMRLKIFHFYFPSPAEGTNTVEFDSTADGRRWALKATYPITRKVDDSILSVATPYMREHGVPVDSLFVRKPELVIAQYRILTKEQLDLVDRVLDIKPGSPSMDIKEVKRSSGSTL